jgi:YVTN family beta-propeller protein
VSRSLLFARAPSPETIAVVEAETGGVVTILHADVEGSTAFATHAGDALARGVLDATKRLVRELCEERGGRQIDAVGDAMMLTFTSPRAAIGAAIDVQEALAARERDRPDETLRVRIGINVGEVLSHDDAPFGAAVNAGARVMALGDGGDVLVTEMAQRLAGTMPGVAFRDRGRHAFKGFDEPWRVYRVDWAGAPPSRPKRRQRAPQRLLLLGAVAVVVAAAVVVAVLVAGRSGGRPMLQTLRPNSIGLLDAAGDGFVESVAVGGGPVALAESGSTLWVGNGDGQTVSRVDERTGSVVATIPVGGHPSAIVADAHGAWVAEAGNRRLVRVDGEFERARAPIAAAVTSLVLAGGYLWDATADQMLERRDSETGRLLHREMPDLGATALVVAGDTLWVTGGGHATPYDPTRGVQTGPPVQLAAYNGFVASSGSRFWVLGTSLQEVDGRSGAVLQTVPLNVNPIRAAGPEIVAPTPAAVFVANTTAGTVLRVDPVAHEVRPLRIHATPRALLATARGVWVAAS